MRLPLRETLVNCWLLMSPAPLPLKLIVTDCWPKLASNLLMRIVKLKVFIINFVISLTLCSHECRAAFQLRFEWLETFSSRFQSHDRFEIQNLLSSCQAPTVINQNNFTSSFEFAKLSRNELLFWAFKTHKLLLPETDIHLDYLTLLTHLMKKFPT